MGLRGRPPLPSSELLRIHDAYLKKRIAGKSHDKAREAVAKKLFRDVRNVEKAISEARKRGIAKKVTPATLRALRELGGNK
jgi:predicted Ser/Thr protein kinase